MTRLEYAKKFNEVWQDGHYDGFSRGTSGETTTPLLDAFVQRLLILKHEGKGNASVLEGGAGSGDHTITLAQVGFPVTAVEYSEVAARSLEVLKSVQPCCYRDRITVVQDDLLRHLNNGVKPFEGFYANSVLHFFSSEERSSVYSSINRAQKHGGLVAVSFKAEGDALQFRGDLEIQTEAGTIVKGEDGISRLFVGNPEPLKRELTGAGYHVAPEDIYCWEVQGYNESGVAGKFVGFIGSKEVGK